MKKKCFLEISALFFSCQQGNLGDENSKWQWSFFCFYKTQFRFILCTLCHQVPIEFLNICMTHEGLCWHNLTNVATDTECCI